MRSTRFIILLFIALSAPCPGRAQTQPDKPASPSPDYSKEAFLFEHFQARVTLEADGKNTRELTGELKMLDDAGVKAFGVLNFTYGAANEVVEVDYVRVRKPDGTVVNTPDYNIQDMPADITRAAPMYSDIHEKHIAVKGLGVGDVLQYHVRFRTVKPEIPGHFWFEYSFTKDHIIKDERLEFSFPKDKFVNVVSPEFKPDIKDDGARRFYRWTSSNLERKEKNSDEVQVQKPLKPSVQITTFRSWEEVGQWFGDIQKEPLKVTPAIQAKAAELTKGLHSDDAKIRAIYNYVSLRFHYIGLDFGIGRYQPHAAEDVLGNEYGDCKDKHTLLAALLKAADYDAWPALIHTSRKLDPDVPSPAQFNHVITVVPTGGSPTWLDTTAEVAPFGMLMAMLRDKQALVIPYNKIPALMTTPAEPPFPQEQRFSIDAKLASDGTLAGHVEQTYRGDTEVALRAALRQAPPAQWEGLMQDISRRLGFEGEVKKVQVTSPEKTDQPLHVSYEYIRKSYSDWENGRITPPLPPLIVKIADDNRKKPSEPVALGALGEIVYSSKLELPPGYFIDAPRNCKLAESYAEYHATNEFQNGQLTTSRRFVIKKSQVTPAEWEAFQKFGKAVNDDQFTFIYLRFPMGDRPSGSAAAAADHFRRGWELNEKGDLDGAVVEYRAALQLNPNAAEAHYNLGLVLKRKGDLDGAVVEYRAALQLNPNDADAHYDLGLVLDRKGDLDGAIAEYRAALRLKPDDGDTRYNLGLVRKRKGDLDGAIAEYRAAIQLNPNDADAYSELGVALVGKGDLDGAIAQYRTALQLNPNDTHTHYDLGNALWRKGDLDGAIAEYRAAIQLDPNAHDAHYNLGLSLVGKGDLDGAIAEYRAALRLKPDDAITRSDLGSALRLKRDLDGAIAEYREALELNPNDADTHFNLGASLVDKGDLDGAIAELKAGIRLKPDYADGVIAQLKTGIRLKPDYARAHYMLGALLEARGDLEAALEEYRSASQLEPHDGDFRKAYEKLSLRLKP